MLDTPFSVGKAKENITIWYLVWINIDLNNTSKRLMSQLSIKRYSFLNIFLLLPNSSDPAAPSQVLGP